MTGFPNPTLEALSNEFMEALRIEREAKKRIVAIFDRYAEEAREIEPHLSEQEKLALVEKVTELANEMSVDIPPERPSHITFGKYAGWRFEDINSWYLDWIIRNVHDEHVVATARYHLELRYGRALCEIETRPRVAARLQATDNDLAELFNLEIDNS